ncbi:MAG: hypothetical protein LBJ19_01255 [Holosporaceae bacterium]|jgi:hypothetical protein|nr:hypothetical protein [Holosporaceae bacterium]
MKKLLLSIPFAVCVFFNSDCSGLIHNSCEFSKSRKERYLDIVFPEGNSQSNQPITIKQRYIKQLRLKIKRQERVNQKSFEEEEFTKSSPPDHDDGSMLEKRRRKRERKQDLLFGIPLIESVVSKIRYSV